VRLSPSPGPSTRPVSPRHLASYPWLGKGYLPYICPLYITQH
jgi:hypothetical protein